jgi:glycosyltransferase involved in cell wall biosynthesis
MFAGNIGASQDFESILGAAESLKEYKNIHWIIIGDGRMFPWVQEQVNKRGLSDTFHLLGRHPLALMPAFFAQANVMLVSLKKKPIFALTIPAKVQSYLACSRPIIAAIDGEGARVVEDAAAGLTCPPEEPGLLAKTVLQASKMPAEDLEEMARRGRYYFEKNFDSTTLVNRLEGWFAEVAGKKK